MRLEKYTLKGELFHLVVTEQELKALYNVLGVAHGAERLLSRSESDILHGIKDAIYSEIVEG